MIKTSRKAQLVAVLLLSVIAFVSACSHRRAAQVGSHKVIIARHGLTENVKHDVDAGSFEYEGRTASGKSFKFALVGDKVRVNDTVVGMLRKGDSIVVDDDGLLVNSMDHGESEKYLRANNAPAQASK